MNLSDKKVYSRPLMLTQVFEPQQYCAICTWRATLHCGIYGNRDYRSWAGGAWHYYDENGAEHGTACQNTVVTVREDKNGNITITGQEVPKGSPVTYAQAPEIVWGRQGVGTSLSPQSGSNRGSLYSWARWNSNDVNGTGDYIHLGYVASWEEFPEGSNSNVS